MLKRLPLLVPLLLPLLAAPALAVEVSGYVRVNGRAKATTATVVYAEPLDGPAPVRPGTFQMIQKNKTFIPHVLAIPVGSTVEFPNQDPIFHNVFSLMGPRPFDLGLYRSGASKRRTFTEPAAYRVFCNIHPQMAAVILILPTSFITETYPAGTYRLDIPPGRYRLTAWSEISQPVSAQITVGHDPLTVPELTLDEAGFLAPPHKNKYGQDYPRTSYDPLRGSRPR